MSADLHAKLGLRPVSPFRDIWEEPPHGWHDLGTVTVRPNGPEDKAWADVRVEVTYAPATFWRFTIEPLIEDVHHAILTTGSGCLADYWPAVMLFATGMLGVEP